MVLMWFRNDIRLHDNTALIRAEQTGPVVHAVYIDCPDQDEKHNVAPTKRAFKQACVAELDVALRRDQLPLTYLTIPSYADVPEALLALCQKIGVTTVYANREYGVNEIARDKAVAKLLREHGITLRLPHDQTIVAPDKIETQQGKPYTVFTPFYRNWLTKLPLATQALLTQSSPLMSNDSWPAGESAGLNRLSEFMASGVASYSELRDIPIEPGTSQLSPYLAVGALSPRLCLWRAQSLAECDHEGVQTWIKELAWRDFYIYIVFHFPRVSMNRAFQQATESIRWRDDEQQFQAWCDGKTGIPIVDAAMRQLVQTGWMHNRLRMVTAMFLTKHLLIDWRRGEQFFMRHLIDGHLASNNGGWQWAASTGTDAAPYFRIFNPVRQSERFDPKGHFIRKYVPELASLSDKSIHMPTDMERLTLDEKYPAPIVDLAMGRDRAITAFKAIKENA